MEIEMEMDMMMMMMMMMMMFSEEDSYWKKISNSSTDSPLFVHKKEYQYHMPPMTTMEPLVKTVGSQKNAPRTQGLGMLEITTAALAKKNTMEASVRRKKNTGLLSIYTALRIMGSQN